MNKPVRIVVLVLAIIVIAGAIWFSAEKENNAPQQPGISLQIPTSTVAVPTSTVSSTIIVARTGSSTLTETFTSWRSYSSASDSVTFEYPLTWSMATTNPIEIDNFNHAYLSGGINPPGGAEIDMVPTTFYNSLSQFIAGDLVTATATSSVTIAVGNRECTEVFYDDSYGPGANSKNVAVYCPQGTSMFKIYLAYWANDPNGSQYLTILKQMLSTMEFGK